MNQTRLVTQNSRQSLDSSDPDLSHFGGNSMMFNDVARFGGGLDETQALNKTKIFNRVSINDEHSDPKGFENQNTQIFNDCADATMLADHKGGHIIVEDQEADTTMLINRRVGGNIGMEDFYQKSPNISNIFEATMVHMNTSNLLDTTKVHQRGSHLRSSSETNSFD